MKGLDEALAVDLKPADEHRGDDHDQRENFWKHHPTKAYCGKARSSIPKRSKREIARLG